MEEGKPISPQKLPKIPWIPAGFSLTSYKTFKVDFWNMPYCAFVSSLQLVSKFSENPALQFMMYWLT
jgi:hypothetical protein